VFHIIPARTRHLKENVITLGGVTEIAGVHVFRVLQTTGEDEQIGNKSCRTMKNMASFTRPLVDSLTDDPPVADGRRSR